MIIQQYSIRDLKIGLFNRPFAEANNLTAIRAFKSLVDDPQTLMGKYPADFELWQVGSFNEQEGEFTNNQTMLVSGLDLLQKAAS